jgi:hypothetical protein
MRETIGKLFGRRTVEINESNKGNPVNAFIMRRGAFRGDHTASEDHRGTPELSAGFAVPPTWSSLSLSETRLSIRYKGGAVQEFQEFYSSTRFQELLLLIDSMFVKRSGLSREKAARTVSGRARIDEKIHTLFAISWSQPNAG